MAGLFANTSQRRSKQAPRIRNPLSIVIDRVKSSTNEVGGRVLELSGTRYMIRGLGYLKSLSDLENVPVSQEWHPVLIKDLGTVYSVRIWREGVVEWQGDGETVAHRGECATA